MIDKKRLEEIDLNKTYNECGITGDLLSMELKPNDYYDLLEQAERTIDYDNNLISLEDNKQYVSELIKQNKRYREAIEVAIQNMVACKNLGVKFALKILEQALEVEQ